MHNRLYWTSGEYLGLGVSAHSFRRLPDGSGERFANLRGVESHLEIWGGRSAPIAFTPAPDAPGLQLHEPRSAEELAREALWLGLRALDGLSCERFASQHGYDPRQRHAELLARLVERGLLERSGEILRLSPRGALFADEVGAEFL